MWRPHVRLLPTQVDAVVASLVVPSPLHRLRLTCPCAHYQNAIRGPLHTPEPLTTLPLCSDPRNQCDFSVPRHTAFALSPRCHFTTGKPRSGASFSSSPSPLSIKPDLSPNGAPCREYFTVEAAVQC